MSKVSGQPVFNETSSAKDILDFMASIADSMAKGEDISGLFEVEGVDKTTEVKSRSQKAAIEILDGPKFDNKLKEDVASYLNSLRDSEIPPNSSREQLMERFINNVYEEVGYYLFSKPDARSAGLTWYIEDMVEFENKVKVIIPELSNEKQYKLFLSILAFTSSGTNPNQNLSYAYNLWNNSNDPKNFDFSKDWGDKKLSFVDKKGKAVASGVIVKETAKEYTVELVDSLGRPEVDSKGNKKYEKISKASMKPGYPKSTGYTNRGKIIVGQLEKLEKLYAEVEKEKFGINPFAGISFGYGIRRDGIYLNPDLYSTSIVKSELFTSTFQTGAQFTFGLEQFMVSIIPVYRMSLGPVVNQGIVRNSYKSVGLQMGLSYRF
jgi:hypothetical protein